MIAIFRLLMLVAAFAVANRVLGWWSAAGVGILWGLLAKGGSRPALTSGVAAGAAWLALLVTLPLDETRNLADVLGRLLSTPPVVLATATVGLGVLLGFLGGWLGAALSRRWFGAAD